jgi:hypothetical protein
MKILKDSNLNAELKDSTLLIDTNILITALFFPEYLKFFTELSNNGCGFVTVDSVYFEFIRGSDCLETLNFRIRFFKELKISIYPIEKELDKLQDGIVVLQKVLKGADYTDFKLCLCLYKFRNSTLDKYYVLTENHKHFPIDILNRKYLITLDNDKEIRNHAFYEISNEKIEKAAIGILKKYDFGELNPEDIPF